MRLHRLALAVVAVIVPPVIGRGQSTQAAEPVGDSSLKMVSADAAFYSTSLRLGEQFERFLHSNAFAKLKELPAAKLLVQHLHDEAKDPNNPVHHITEALKDPANKQLAELLHDLPRHEIFFYGGAGWSDMLPILKKINTAQYSGPIQAIIAGKPQETNMYQGRAMLDAVNSSADKLAIPEMVLGFKLSDGGPANEQITRLEAALKHATENSPLKGRVKRVRVGDTEALTLTVDGSMIPVDKAPWDQIEEREGQYDNLRKRIKSLKLAISLLVKDNYLLLTIGPDTKVAERLTHGPALGTRPEFSPLAKFADKKLLAVGYASKALIESAATRPEDVSGVVEFIRNGLDKLPISEKNRTSIDKDLKRYGDEVIKHLPKPGAMVSFAFMTDRGQESFAYDYTINPDAPEEKSLSILDHLGGSPLLAIAGVVNDPTPGYKAFVELIRNVWVHAEAVGKEFAPEQVYQQFQQGLEMIKPFVKRLDSITGEQLLPALGAGEIALVVDAKWTSKKWFAEFDQHDAALPLPEFSIVRTVSNEDTLVAAFAAYRKLASDLITQANAFGANLPIEELPKPASEKVADGTLFFWPMDLPGEPLDKQVQPTVGLSGHLFAISLSKKHSERLLKKTPLTVAHAPLNDKRPATMAVVVNFGGMVRMVRPWVEKLALPQIVEQIPDNAPPGLGKKDVPDQVKTVLDVLGCLRTYTALIYREGDVTVTHGELVIRDLGQR
jgi:hypothetical protein